MSNESVNTVAVGTTPFVNKETLRAPIELILGPNNVIDLTLNVDLGDVDKMNNEVRNRLINSLLDIRDKSEQALGKLL